MQSVEVHRLLYKNNGDGLSVSLYSQVLLTNVSVERLKCYPNTKSKTIKLTRNKT